MLIHTTGLAETATTNNLLPNAGTGQTSVQHSNSTIDGINSSNGFTLNGITDYSSNFNELEAIFMSDSSAVSVTSRPNCLFLRSCLTTKSVKIEQNSGCMIVCAETFKYKVAS